MVTAAPSTKLAGDRCEIGGYEVISALSAGQSWLATASGGRLLVLKTLDEDCLWKGQLHPNVKDRLGRVRELAHPGVANLYGVERDGALSYLVWEYVQGQALDEYATSPRCAQRDFLLLARELVLSVEMLHARGVVHGTLRASNVIVNAEDRVVITHVSPLLYTDPAEDVQAVVALLIDLASKRGESDAPLGRMLAQVDGAEISPRRLAARLGALIESRDSDPVEQEPDRIIGRSIRRRAMMGATSAAVLAVMLFVGMRQYASATTPKPPVPPQANPAALQPASRGESPSASVVLRRAGQ